MHLRILSLPLLCLLGSCSSVLLGLYDDGVRNRSKLKAPYKIQPEAVEFHKQLLVADMHADPLMLDRGGIDGIRNLNRRGHVDVPRMINGNVGIQMLTVVSHASLDLIEPAGPSPDAMRLLTRAQGWPRETWNSPRARALYQAEKWNRLAEDPRVFKILSRAALRRFLSESFAGHSPNTWTRREDVDRRTAILLGIEGVHAFEDLSDASSDEEIEAEIDAFFSIGFRLFGVSHLFDNDFGASSQGHAVADDDTGLTPLGKRVVQVLDKRSVIFDVAHASPESIDDLLALTDVPLIYSHGGIRAHTCGNRNLETRHVLEIARRGGVICIGYWKAAVGDVSLDSIASAIEKTAEILATDPEIADPWNHIGIGSDFDGAVNTLFNCDGHGLLTEELLRRGHSESVIRRVMGGNVAAFLLKTLPKS